ncbi:MAG TPA: response regulator [Gemmatimonadaceae bacterium]|nr:response regulator [Gemmatimonadaceae bacterium]
MTYVLFADDHADTRGMVRDIFEASGYEVLAVADGSAAMRAVLEREPDLLVLDLNMPGLSGLEVCRQIKANPFTAHVPVLMLTAQGEIEVKVEGFEAGADDYLAKPFDPRELRARASALLRIVRREGDRNPTTGLPGGRAIEQELERRVLRGETFAVAYIDLDNFKAFADTFGFTEADRVIRETGAAMRAACNATGGPGAFVGHIGGDDFLLILDPAHAEPTARAAAERFRAVVAGVVGEQVVARGTFEGHDRDGNPRQFPIARLAVVILMVEPARWVSPTHLGVRAAELKRRAKQQGAGTLLTGAV